MTAPEAEQIPFKPYMVRAVIDWCEDSGYRPYVVVQVDDETVVPREFVRDGKITLSLFSEAIHNPDFRNDAFDFAARFGEVSRNLHIPVRSIVAVFPAEHPELGMGFPYEGPGASSEELPEEEPKVQPKRASFIQKVK